MARVGKGDARTIAVVVDGDAVVASWQVDCRDRPNLAVVDTLAKLQLSARRLGLSVRLTDPSAELCELLDLVGLADWLEAGRKTEGGEQLGVEEVVEPRDPAS